MAIPDIVERLQRALVMRPGTSNSDINVLNLPVDVPYGDVWDAIKEIERLRGTNREPWTAAKIEDNAKRST